MRHRPPPRMSRHGGGDRVHGGHQAVGRDLGERLTCWTDAGLRGDHGADVVRQLRGEERARDALRDRPVEHARRARHRQQGGDRARARGLAEHGDVLRVAAEGPDVVAHPGQCGDLVEKAPVGGRALDLPESLHGHAVVERHHDDPAFARQPRAVVDGVGGVPDQVGAAVDPDHHRKTSGARFGCPDVAGQPVVTGRLRRVGGERGRLRRGRPERGGGTDPVPSFGRLGRREAQRAHGRPGVGDAAEDGEAVLAHTAHGAVRGGRLDGHGPPGPGRQRMPSILPAGRAADHRFFRSTEVLLTGAQVTGESRGNTARRTAQSASRAHTAYLAARAPLRAGAGESGVAPLDAMESDVASAVGAASAGGGVP